MKPPETVEAVATVLVDAIEVVTRFAHHAVVASRVVSERRG